MEDFKVTHKFQSDRSLNSLMEISQNLHLDGRHPHIQPFLAVCPVYPSFSSNLCPQYRGIRHLVIKNPLLHFMVIPKCKILIKDIQGGTIEHFL